MDGKAAIVFPIITSLIMSLLMSAAITLVNLGADGFLLNWMRSWAVAFPLATAAAFLAVPIARRWTMRIVGWLEGRSP